MREPWYLKVKKDRTNLLLYTTKEGGAHAFNEANCSCLPLDLSETIHLWFSEIEHYDKNYFIASAGLGTDTICYEEQYTVVTGIVLFHHIIKSCA